jgi:hypothetical protein
VQRYGHHGALRHVVSGFVFAGGAAFSFGEPEPSGPLGRVAWMAVRSAQPGLPRGHNLLVYS